MQTDIREFDVQSIKQDGVIAIVGKRGSGKSVLIRDLLHKTAAKLPKQKYDVALAMSPVYDSLETAHDALKTVSNEVTIMPDFNENALAAFLDKMEEFSRHLDRTNVAEACHGLVLMDGCTLNRTCMRTLAMRRLFLNGRHFRITLVCVFSVPGGRTSHRFSGPPLTTSLCSVRNLGPFGWSCGGIFLACFQGLTILPRSLTCAPKGTIHLFLTTQTSL